MTLLACDSAARSFGPRVALAGVTLNADAGEIVGVVGPNGAGKTTLFRLIAGDLTLSAGNMLVGGHRAGKREARLMVGLAADPPLAPVELSGLEWLNYLASHRARSPAERVDLVREAVELGDLAEFGARRIATYSRGMAQRLGLAAAALCARNIVLLDETLGGMDPLVARSLRGRIQRLAGGGRLVLLASHDLSTVEQLATRAVVLWRGRVAADVAMATLLSERVAELSLNGGSLSSAAWLLQRFPGASRTGEGVALPLVGGLGMEQVMAECRSQRIAVAASRVRYRRLEDILVTAAQKDPVCAGAGFR
ncbi:MAG: ABC transporter ATP-binding protein [Gemmatimonadetes bacterium]|nr:ABC transporter ATP-binding protein [Gemmatimonadota bacterium]